MTDETNLPVMPSEPEAEHAEPDPGPSAPGPSASDAWGEVLSSVAEFGDAISSWARTAANEPRNRGHLEELRKGVNDMTRQADEAFSAVADSEFGQHLSESASQAGEAIGSMAAEFGQAAAPHIATAFAGLADVFGRAAQRVGEAAGTQGGSEPATRPAPEPPSADAVAAPRESKPGSTFEPAQGDARAPEDAHPPEDAGAHDAAARSE